MTKKEKELDAMSKQIWQETLLGKHRDPSGCPCDLCKKRVALINEINEAKKTRKPRPGKFRPSHYDPDLRDDFGTDKDDPA